MAAHLELENLTKRWNGVASVDGIGLAVERGEFVCLLGPSGCGKTTTLRMIAGFLEPDAGEIRVNGKRVSAPGAVVPLHEHTALEQTYVIEGSLEDHEGKCGPGQFVWRPAGNQHEAVAPDGAVILGFFLKPNRFAYGEKFFTAPGER